MKAYRCFEARPASARESGIGVHASLLWRRLVPRLLHYSVAFMAQLAKAADAVP
jgi:hypothetical protein